MVWVAVNDAQTLSWGGNPFDLTTAFQADAFQFTPLAFQIAAVIGGWTPVDDTETADWIPVPT